MATVLACKNTYCAYWNHDRCERSFIFLNHASMCEDFCCVREENRPDNVYTRAFARGLFIFPHSIPVRFWPSSRRTAETLRTPQIGARFLKSENL